MMNTKYISHKNGGYTMKETNGKVKPFGIKDKLGYMFGEQMLWEFQQHL